MEITIFAKKRQTRQGKIFYNYLTTLQNKNDGTELTCDVKFREDAGAPKPESCPINVIVEKGDCNLAKRHYNVKRTDEFTGEVVEQDMVRSVLWISAWKPGGAYVDHSMDDFI